MRTGKKGINAEELAKRILNRYRSLRQMDSALPHELCRIEGIGPAKAAQLKAALELGKRLCREKAQKQNRIQGPREARRYVAEYYGPYLRDAGKELFCLILLDRKNKPIHHLELSRGSVCASIVDPKEIFREVFLHSASSIILVHNHPSGEPEPSGEDIDITRRLREGCVLFGIDLIDHVIIGRNEEDHFSFARAGML